ncbi:MAG: 3-beta hydroxysteroid dehydrogenase/isomerase family protein [Proteobacteria bacterium]|nr:3-beta hydroxysteroid dehydrogenase/isomerase family protein [Pseudomonadota bacterium]
MPLVREEKPIVTIFGASGFLGRHVVRALAKRDWRIRAACRRPDLAAHLQPLGGVGQIMPMQANLRYRASVDRAVSGADAVVNLVGILSASGRQTHAAVQAFGARAVAEASAAAGISRLVHVSAIGADAASRSIYARTKAAGEAAVFDVAPDAVVLRPSVVFGPEDHFINMFGELAARSPVLPLIGGGLTLLQPVFVTDVAEAIARAVEGQVTGGRIYELGGPEVLTFRAIIERLLAETDRQPYLLTIPFGLAALAARLTFWLPGAPLTPDQVELLKAGSVVSAAAIGEGRTFEALGIAPTSLGAVLPEYAVRFRPHGQYDRDKASA